MERHEALKLHLGQKVYVLSKSNDLERLSIIHLVYRGEEIRIICANDMESWEDTCVNFFQDVFTSEEKALEVFKKKMTSERDALQCRIDQINANFKAGNHWSLLS